MGWQDRGYTRPVNYGGNPFSSRLSSLVFGSIYVGTLFRTRIRIHASLIWYIALTVAFSGHAWKDALIGSLMLFGIVFLHEFGHIFACRSVGGDADEVMMWVLGGLATCGSPRRPWPTFVTVAGGPLVNVILGLTAGAAIYFGFGTFPPLNPLFPFVPSMLHDYANTHPAIWPVYFSKAGPYLLWFFFSNWAILFFNLIPMFPLDGGRMLQAILWRPLGYFRSMKFACILGMVVSVALGLAGLFLASFIFFIALFAFLGSLQELRILRANEAEESNDGYDLSAAWDHTTETRPARRKRGKKRWLAAARKRALKDQAEQARIDAILVKVKEKGLHSLTWWEKRSLKKATERQRQRDLAERY